MHARTVVAVLAIVAGVCQAAIFQDQVVNTEADKPVFQDQVPREGFIEIEPGVYAPKITVPVLKPRRPFEFDDEAHLKSEITLAYHNFKNEADMMPMSAFDGFVNKLMNPSDLKMYDVEQELLSQSLATFKRQQGITDEESRVLAHGFLNRGKPLKFFRKLSEDMVALRKKTREALLKAGKKSDVESIEGSLEAIARSSSPFDDGKK